MSADPLPATTADAGRTVERVPPALTRRSTPPVDHLFQTIVDASFDLIEELGTIDMSIYLHVPHDDQPLLFARSPDLGMLSPSENFRLMHTITMLSNGRKPVAAFRHGELSGHYVRTTGAHSDGLFVFGPIQGSAEAERISAVTVAFARVLHQFHLDDTDGDVPGHSPDAMTPQLTVSTTEDRTDVDAVAVRSDGVSSITGTGSAARPEDAVGKAVVNALAPTWEFDEIRTIDVGMRSAVLAVLRDDRAILQLGLAISSGDVLQTAALATRRAIVDA